MIGMKAQFFKALCFSLTLGATLQTVNAATISKGTKPVTSSISLDKQSPIEKALTQQKRDRTDSRLMTDNDQIRLMTSMNTAPTQNFLAAQHQRFSRFVQAIFPQHNS